MIIISPYAKPGYTDSTTADFASILAMIEHRWGLAPLTPLDANAYDYSNSFDFSTVNPSKPHMVYRPLPAKERAYLAEHPSNPNDPT